MGTSDDLVPSGLIVRGDGSVEDRVLSRTLFDVTRGPRVSLSSVDVVIDGTRYRLPEGRLVATAPPTAKQIAIQIRAHDDFVHGSGVWHAIDIGSSSADHVVDRAAFQIIPGDARNSMK